MRLPRQFLWTRYGAEAGESADTVLRRKEAERIRNDGLFLWGIGNSMAPAVRHFLVRAAEAPPAVVFSPMRSLARREDMFPRAVARWTRAIGLDGEEWPIPPGSTVTSRIDSAKGEKRRHYALVCRLDSALVADEEGPRFSISDVHNYVSGAPVGHSQVTSLVRYSGQDQQAGDYVAAVIAQLTYPYVLELFVPVVTSEPASTASTRTRTSVEGMVDA